jgi:ABC-2 type transport system permease protein
MSRSWIFFKLRMLQLKADKTALFFCYVLPIGLLLLIGYPMQMRSDARIDVYYDMSDSSAGQQLVGALQASPLLNLQPYVGGGDAAHAALERNEIKHYLRIDASGYQLHENSLAENQIENVALRSLVENQLRAPSEPGFATRTVATEQPGSYVETLLPGLLGMTLLIIGLGGFGAVLITERQHGLYRNIKTIDVSPVPFLAGLFASRLVVCYTVAITLVLLGMLVFDISTQVNFVLLVLVITLGCGAFLGLGLMLSTLSPSVSAFNGIINVVQMPLVVLGGVFFSISVFPQWLQSIANVLPLTQLNSAMRSILFESVGFADISQLLPQLASLAVWCVLTLGIARVTFKW